MICVAKINKRNDTKTRNARFINESAETNYENDLPLPLPRRLDQKLMP